MNKLGLIESLRQQITSLEDEVEAGYDSEGKMLDEADEAYRYGMIAQCELLIDEYEKDTEPEVNGHELKRRVGEWRKAIAERLTVATAWGKQHPELPFRESPDCNRVNNNVYQQEECICAIFNDLAMDAGLSIGELDGFFSDY